MSLVVDIWKEGTYWDFWSVPHFLAGMLLASLGHYLGLAFWQVAVPAVILLIGWEFFEAARGITETMQNRIVDVLLGVAGFIAMIFIFVRFDGRTAFIVTMGALFLWAVLNFWGFLIYLRR